MYPIGALICVSPSDAFGQQLQRQSLVLCQPQSQPRKAQTMCCPCHRTILKVNEYFTGVFGLNGTDLLMEGYPFGMMLPSLSSMARMTMYGSAKKLFADDLDMLNQMVILMCQGQTQAGVITGESPANNGAMLDQQWQCGAFDWQMGDV